MAFVLFRPGKDVWAFGVEPAKVRYRLRLARYPALAEYLQDWIQKPQQTQTNDQHEPFELLDIGAGFGRSFLYIQAQGIAERFNLTGMDINPRRKDDVYAGNPWNIVAGDAEQDLDYPDDSLDVVICEQLLEHLNHPDVVLKNVQRVLRPGGLFIVGVPIFPEPIARLRRWAVNRFGLRGSEHIQTYSLRSLRQDLAAGFTEIEARGFRIISGGPLRKLENYKWWLGFNRRLGAWLPGLCIEVQMIVTPRQDQQP